MIKVTRRTSALHDVSRWPSGTRVDLEVAVDGRGRTPECCCDLLEGHDTQVVEPLCLALLGRREAATPATNAATAAMMVKMSFPAADFVSMPSPC